MTKTMLVVLGLLLALAGCSDDSEDGIVTAAQLPTDLCGLVPAGQVERWSLVEETSSTDNGGPTNSADCTMTGGPDLADPRLELRVDSLAGGDVESATKFTADRFAATCGNVRSHGEYADTRDQCTATAESEGILTLTSATRLRESHSVVWVQLVTPAEDADAADDAVDDLVEATRQEVGGAAS